MRRFSQCAVTVLALMVLTFGVGAQPAGLVGRPVLPELPRKIVLFVTSVEISERIAPEEHGGAVCDRNCSDDDQSHSETTAKL